MILAKRTPDRNPVKQRSKTLLPKLRLISEDISDALLEARKIRELTIQEEVVVELDKVNDALLQAKKQITRLLRG
jgi:hypothetical protein